jgi:predicted nucleotidyltransferase component of viral defense system
VKVAASPIGRELVFGGGAALAMFHLHHRTSEDLDFFLSRELEPAELAPLAASLESASMKTELEVDVSISRSTHSIRSGAEHDGSG